MLLFELIRARFALHQVIMLWTRPMDRVKISKPDHYRYFKFHADKVGELQINPSLN